MLQYPGSEKGADPQDDPEHYLQWFKNTYPPDVVEGVTKLAGLIRGETEVDDAEEEEIV